MQQDILHDTPMYQYIFKESFEIGRQEGRKIGLEIGLQEGRKEGRLVAVREVLLAFVYARFLKLEKLAIRETDQIQNPEILIDLTLKVGLAQNRSEAIDYLIDWEETYKDLL